MDDLKQIENYIEYRNKRKIKNTVIKYISQLKKVFQFIHIVILMVLINMLIGEILKYLIII